ncbi:hypothetical protein MJ547_04550, partial [Burkholderia gladioli]
MYSVSNHFLRSISLSPRDSTIDTGHQGLLRRAHGIARHAGEDDSRSRKVDLRKARQRSVIALKHHGLDRTPSFAY